MNLWGFTPDIFKKMQTALEDFLRAPHPDPLKAEYALPTMVDSLISKNELKVELLSTDSRWFGMTYIEDRPTVAAALASKHKDGEYPERLF